MSNAPANRAAEPRPDIINLDASMACQLGDMTFPAYRHLLNLQVQRRHQDEADRRLIQPLALAAVYAGQVIGLALIELPTEAGFRPELLSIFVRPIARRRGVAQWLLAATEQVLLRLGHSEVMTVYMTGKPSIATFERLLAKRGWQTPHQRMITVRFEAEKLAGAEWINKYQPRAGYRIGAWSDVTAAEREQLQLDNQQHGWIASDLEPWSHDEYGYEPITSVAIYRHDAIVGWLINHLLDEETVRYTCSFIRPDLARAGGILPAYVESFARLRAAGFKRGMFVTPLHHPAMMRFAERYFGPWASFMGQTRGSSKLLDAQSTLAQKSSTEAIPT